MCTFSRATSHHAGPAMPTSYEDSKAMRVLRNPPYIMNLPAAAVAARSCRQMFHVCRASLRGMEGCVHRVKATCI
jgi:hypothetical protein